MKNIDNLTMYCLCLENKVLKAVENLNYVPVGLGNGKFSKDWTKDDTLQNISHKNKYYSEYSFYYWFWKNVLPEAKENHWIGFCAYRDFWSNKKEITNNHNFKINKEKVPCVVLGKNIKLKDLVVQKIPDEWNGFNTILGERMYINNLKFSKLIKRGLWSLIRNPSALFKSKRNIRFHFDMWHGNGNLDKAIDLLDDKDKKDFRNFTRTNNSFSRGCMFVCNSKEIINNYFDSLFPWLERCEKIFGFNLEGYGNKRIYAFLAERYQTYWFNKYSKPLIWPVIFYDISNTH